MSHNRIIMICVTAPSLLLVTAGILLGAPEKTEYACISENKEVLFEEIRKRPLLLDMQLVLKKKICPNWSVNDLPQEVKKESEAVKSLMDVGIDESKAKFIVIHCFRNEFRRHELTQNRFNSSGICQERSLSELPRSIKRESQALQYYIDQGINEDEAWYIVTKCFREEAALENEVIFGFFRNMVTLLVKQLSARVINLNLGNPEDSAEMLNKFAGSVGE